MVGTCGEVPTSLPIGLQEKDSRVMVLLRKALGLRATLRVMKDSGLLSSIGNPLLDATSKVVKALVADLIELKEVFLPCPMAPISLGKNVAVGVPMTISGTVPGEHPYGVLLPGLCKV